MNLTMFKWVMVALGMLVFSNAAFAQVTYYSEGFNNGLSMFSVTNGTAAYRTGNSGTGDRPASSPYAFEGTHGFSCVNTNITLQSSVINTQGICGASLSFDLAAFSLGTTGNGVDAADLVRVDISPDNGANYYRTLDVNGNNNAYWAFSATGVASTAYDGNANTVTFAPAGGGSRTTDGYSTVQISNLPNVSQLIIRIYLTTSANSEGWVIDDFKIQGNPPSAMSTSPATRCTPGTLTLGATASGCGLTPTIAWFANASGGSALPSATTNPSSYTTPSLSSTTSYYVEQQYAAGVGVGTNSGNIISTGVGLAFTAHTAFTLNSVVMRIRKNSATDGAMTVLIKDNAGAVINTINLVIPGAANNNNNNTYNIGHTFTPGNYTMEVSSMSANITRVYFTSGMAYPLHYGALSITGNVGNAASTYNYFYDWSISLPRQEVIATIGTNVTPSVSVSSSDADNSICSGTSVTFTATPTNGGSAPAYQWKLNGNNVGTNSATYTNGALANNDVVTVVMTANNACQTSATVNGNSITTTVNTTVSPSVSIVSNDADNFICEGTMIVFTATPTNGGTSPVYQWKINGMDMGSNTSTFDTNVLINGDVVSVQMTTNHLCQTQATSNSNALTISVGLNSAPSVAIGSSDGDNVVCQGSSVTYTAIPTNGGSSPSFQWILNGNNIGTNAPTFSNAVNSNQTVSVIMTSNYECQTSSTATANSLDVTVVSNVSPSVSVSSSDTDNAICAGESVTFTATPTNGGPSPSYQWKLNGANVGTNSATYTTTTLPNNGIVTVVMTANNTCQTSANANGNNISTSVTNNVTPAVTVSSSFATNSGNATWAMNSPNSTNVANITLSTLTQNNNFGTTTMLSNVANSTGYTGASGGNNAAAAANNGSLNTATSTYFQFTVTPGASYSFALNNLSMGMRSTGTGPTAYVLRSSLDNYASDIFVGSVATNSTWSLKTHVLSTGNVSAIGQAVTYRIYGYGGSGATINNANWRIDDLVLSFVNSQSVCDGSHVTFTANPTNGGSSPIYQWKLNGTNVGTDATTYTNASLANSDVVTVVMTANNACQTSSTANGNNITTTVVTNVTPSVVVSSSDADNSICSGTSVTFTATPTNGGSTPAYQWKLNGTNVGSDATTYINASLANNDVVTVVMTANNVCQTATTANGNSISTSVLANNNYYADADGDTYGPAASLVVTCIMPAGYTTELGDCDDANSEAYPFNLEICNGNDDDCDGTADNGISTFTFYADQDGDGYGSNSATIVSCDLVAGYLMTNGDCNDALSTVNPQASELCSTSYDDDCDGLINEVCNVVNDDPLFSNLIIPSISLLTCNTVTGNLVGASPSAQVGVETLTGTAPDTWYYFTATSPGVTIRCIPTNDVKLELRTGAGLLVKSANAVNGIGDEYLNYGELTVGGQYYVRVMQMDSPTLGGTFTLCSRRIASSGSLNYTNSILYDSGCDVVYASNITGSTSCSIQLTPISPAGGPVLTGIGSAIPLSNFNGPNGEKFQYNTTYQAIITLGFVLPVGNGGTEVINVPRVSDNNLVVQQHMELDLGSVHACPARVSIGGTVRANIWLCDAVRYQWKFEKTVNGILQLVNGNPVVIEVYGPLGTRDFIPTANMGFTAGSEWRVQVRPVFANGVVGSYGTNYQCMKFKGTAAAMPTVEDESDLEKVLDNLNDVALMLYPNPSGKTSVNVIWNDDESADVQLIVRDMQGRVVQNIEHIQGNQFVINGSDLSGGMYWVEWHSGANTQRLRWMIQ